MEVGHEAASGVSTYSSCEQWIEERKKDPAFMTGYGTQLGDPRCWMMVDGKYSLWDQRDLLDQMLLNKRDWVPDIGQSQEKKSSRGYQKVLVGGEQSPY